VHQVALGLAAAHARGVVHRDIKPSNILLDAGSGRAKLTDFGLARVLAADASASQSGGIVGTPAYMSPEQILSPSRIDARSDIYSLGVVLYELLTGERPFRGLAHMVLQHVVHDEPRSPRSLNDSIPRDLETITLKCLAKEPARRYATAQALADDLEHWAKGQPIQARPIGAAERLIRWCRRNPAVGGLTAAAALLLVAGTLISSYFAIQAKGRAVESLANAKQANDNAAEASRNAKRAEENAAKAQANAAEARANLYAAQMNLAQRDWEAGSVAHVLELLETQHPRRTGEQDLRGWEWYYQERLCHDDLRTLTGTGAVHSVAFSPDGTRLASGCNDRTVKLWHAASGQELRTLTGHAGEVLSVAFSPDGTRLASADSDGTVKVWDPASGRHVSTLKGHTLAVWSVAFSPDERRLASASRDGTVKLWDVASGQELRTLKGHTGRVLSVAFSPDGTRLASAGEDRMVKIWDARPLTPQVRAEQEALGLVELLFSKGLVKTQVLEKLRGNRTISEAVRQKAFAFVDPCWNGVVYQQAVCWVDALFRKPILNPEAIESARINRALGEKLRQKAAALSDRWRKDADLLNDASWAIVRTPGADASAYRLALRQAKHACRLAPDNSNILTTLGVAQYRVGQYLPGRVLH
jgi:hypothetical protein